MIDKNKVLVEFFKKDIKLLFLNDIKSGKEAVVSKVEWDSKIYALKIYKDNSHTSFNRYNKYREGKYIKSPSERRAIQKKNKYGRKIIESSRTALEYKMLEKLYEQGAFVPQVFAYTSNSILMEYLGNENYPAPKIKDVELSQTQMKDAHEKIMENINIFYKNGFVHGDLSEFNILWWKEKPYIIDFPQAIDIRTNPNAEELLERDVQNIKRFFSIK